jgi:hypothetical protein
MGANKKQIMTQAQVLAAARRAFKNLKEGYILTEDILLNTLPELFQFEIEATLKGEIYEGSKGSGPMVSDDDNSECIPWRSI